MKTVLITGAAGYLGSHLAKTFKQAGWKVVGFGHKRHTMNHYIDIMHYGDIRDRELLESLFHHIKFDLASKLNYVIFRFFNLTGADPEGEFGESHEPETHLIPRLILNMDNIEIYGTDYNTKDGTCVRDYVHVTDIAEAHLDAAKYLENGGKSDIFNLGTGYGHTILEVIKELENVAGKTINYKSNPRREGDAMSLIADTKKATHILKYTPKYDIVSILNTAYEWHKHG